MSTISVSVNPLEYVRQHALRDQKYCGDCGFLIHHHEVDVLDGHFASQHTVSCSAPEPEDCPAVVVAIKDEEEGAV